jgi:hypothetical protein
MPREKPKRWSVRFELAPEDPEDVKIYTFLSGLAKRQAASTWLRDTIRAAIEYELKPGAIKVIGNLPAEAIPMLDRGATAQELIDQFPQATVDGMTQTIKAIETRYNGYRFRSRLEARWAVFFDALGVKYEYEPEGFKLPNGIQYLPDFWLPQSRSWVEIKPTFAPDTRGHRKVKAFAEALQPNIRDGHYFVVMLYGEPRPYAKGTCYLLDKDSFNNFPIYLMPPEVGYSKMGIWFPVDCLCEADASNEDKKTLRRKWKEAQRLYQSDLMFAISSARSARFEFGEHGGNGIDVRGDKQK